MTKRSLHSVLYLIILKIWGGRGKLCSPEWKLVWWPPFFILFMPPKELWEAYNNRTVRPSVRQSVSPSVPPSCPVHISYIFWYRNSKFGVWIHLGMAECRVPFLGHCDLWPSFENNRVRRISLILFEVGIPNLVCKCILGWGVSHPIFRSLWPWPLT